MVDPFNPPPSDRELTAEVVRQVMELQFPQYALRSVELLGSGWEYDAYLIDGHTVVRFPRSSMRAKDLDRVQARLDFVRQAVVSNVRVPETTLRGGPSRYFPHHFLGHELIPGVHAKDPHMTPTHALAEDLGRALTQIHGISPAHAAELRPGRQKWNCRTAFDGLVDVLDAVPEMTTSVPEGATWIRRTTTIPAEYGGPDRFIHDDLQPEHIIVDASSGRLSGIIDWGGALGDPAQDFSFVVAWAGWNFTTSVLDAYQAPVDGNFLVRLLFLGRVRALGWLAYELRKGLDTRHTTGVVKDLLSRDGAS